MNHIISEMIEDIASGRFQRVSFECDGASRAVIVSVLVERNGERQVASCRLTQKDISLSLDPMVPIAEFIHDVRRQLEPMDAE